MLVVSRAANANPEADRKHSSQGRGPILVECRTGDRWSSSELEVRRARDVVLAWLTAQSANPRVNPSMG